MPIGPNSAYDAQGNPVARDPATNLAVPLTRDDMGNPIAPQARTPEPIASWKSPTLTQQQAEALRADYIKFGGEGAAERFDKAMLAEGLTPKEPLSPEIQKLHDQVGISAEPKATDYKPEFRIQAENLDNNRFGNLVNVTGAWAAKIGFSRELGTAVLDHIATEGPALARMTPEQQTKWVEQQEALGIKVTGSKQAFAALKEKAMAVLQRAPAFKNAKGQIEDISAAIKNGKISHSVFLIRSLATHADMLNYLDSRKGSK